MPAKPRQPKASARHENGSSANSVSSIDNTRRMPEGIERRALDVRRLPKES
jgi:hypothetical protein